MNLKLLAEHLGLSKTTVSRALAGYADVAASTRERVREAAERHGYRPNPVAQRLRAGRTETVGLVLPGGPVRFGDPFLLELMAGAGERLAEAGFDLIVSAPPVGTSDIAAVDRLVDGKRVDGIILVRPTRRDPRVERLMQGKVPFVCHGRPDTGSAYAFVDVDGQADVADAVSYLAGLGHARIAWIGGPGEAAFSSWRRRGYEQGMVLNALAIDPLLIEDPVVQSRDGGQSATHAILDRASSPPTAILCATDTQAVGCLQALRERGLSVPHDVSVIGYDDLPMAALTDPPLTTLRQPITRIGARLAELVLTLIEGRAQPQDLHDIWRAERIERASTGPARV
jgi:LacI family transcriptional regulator